jgi:hypothetical protein
MHRSLGGYSAAQEGSAMLSRVHCSSVVCAIACCKAPMEVLLVNVLLPERTINEDNKETSAAIKNQGGMPGKKLVRHRHFFR